MSIIEELYDICQKELLKWCSAMTRDPLTAEDLVQEAFLRALTNAEMLESLRPQQRKAWLYRTVKNLYLDRYRRASFEVILDDLPENGQETQEYAKVEADQLLFLLPPKERILFVMRYFQGYNAAELGKIFAMPPATVRSCLSRARKRLRAAIRPERFQKGEHNNE